MSGGCTYLHASFTMTKWISNYLRGQESSKIPIRSDEGLTLETSAFRISVRWPIYITNSVDKTKFLYTTSPPTQHHSFFRNYPFIRKFASTIDIFKELLMDSYGACLVSKFKCAVQTFNSAIQIFNSAIQTFRAAVQIFI